MSVTTVFARELLTTWLVEQVTEVNQFPVGDGVAPTEGGWSGGQPGVGEFVPYTVVGGGRAVPTMPGAVGDAYGDWRVTYTVRAVGASRRQADWVGDRTRQRVTDLVGALLDLDGAWKLTHVFYTALGEMSRVDATDPPYWEVLDTTELWLARSRAS